MLVLDYYWPDDAPVLMVPGSVLAWCFFVQARVVLVAYIWFK